MGEEEDCETRMAAHESAEEESSLLPLSPESLRDILPVRPQPPLRILLFPVHSHFPLCRFPWEEVGNKKLWLSLAIAS
jgi:hypothetical protein